MNTQLGRYIALVLAGVLMVAVLVPSAAGAPQEEDPEEGGMDPMEHVVDAHYMDFEPFGVWELPRILLLEGPQGGWNFEMYASTESALHSGRYNLVFGEGEEQHLIEGSDEEALEEAIAHHEHLHGALEARQGHIVVDLSLTRYLMYVFIAMLITLAVFITLGQRYKRGVGRTEAPRGTFQNMFEAIIVYVRDEMAKPNLGHKYKTFLPYLLSAFFLILFGNLMGLVPYGEAATANIGVTAVLAFFTLIIGHIYASWEHWKHLFAGPPGVPFLIRIIMVPIEVAGIFTRHSALAIRLFANMVSGGLMIVVMIGLIFMMNQLFGVLIGWVTAPISVILTVAIMALKFLVAFIQAYVFTLLSALFIGMEVEEHHEEEGPPPDLDEREEHGDLTPAFAGDGAIKEETRVEEPIAAS